MRYQGRGLVVVVQLGTNQIISVTGGKNGICGVEVLQASRVVYYLNVAHIQMCFKTSGDLKGKLTPL